MMGLGEALRLGAIMTANIEDEAAAREAGMMLDAMRGLLLRRGIDTFSELKATLKVAEPTNEETKR